MIAAIAIEPSAPAIAGQLSRSTDNRGQAGFIASKFTARNRARSATLRVAERTEA